MSCISHVNLCPSSGDVEVVLLQKILQSLNEGAGGGSGAGVSSISVNGGPAETGAVSLTIPAATSPLLNFQDQNAGGDGVVYSDSGTNEVFRTEAGTEHVQFAGAAARIHSSAITDSFTFLATPAKADGGFLEVYGTGHPTGLGGATVSIHDGGQYRIRSAPVASTVSVLRAALDGTTGFFGLGPSTTPGTNLDVNNSTTATKAWFYETTDGLATPTNFRRLTLQTQVGNTLIRTEAGGTGLTVGQPRILQVGTGPSVGANILGTPVFYHSGQSTGTGVRGEIYFLQSAPGAAGVGTNPLTVSWYISDSGHLGAGTDNAYDIGFAGSRPRNLLVSQGIFTGVGGFIGVLSGASVGGFFDSPADGILNLKNGASTNFTRLNFGGSNGNFNAIARDVVNGFTLRAADGTATYNDNSTAASGTVANRYLFGIVAPTLTSTNATVTYTVASSIYIDGAPTASTNVTIGTAYSLNVAAGTSIFSHITQRTAALFSVTSGANQRAGNATLIAGSVTVANTTVTANTIVLYSRKTSGGTIGTAMTYTVSAATSFTLTSDSALDTSTFSYFLIEVP